MTNRAAATRYARALFDVAAREGADLRAVEPELEAFVDLLKQELLQKALLNPAVPAARKRAAIAELAKSAGVSPVAGKLLVLLAGRDRLSILPDLVTAYHDRLLAHLKVVRAELVTAVPLPPEQTREIERSLAGATGRTMSLTTRVDPALIGGLVARVGSTVYDGSITHQLERLREQLYQVRVNE